MKSSPAIRAWADEVAVASGTYDDDAAILGHPERQDPAPQATQKNTTPTRRTSPRRKTAAVVDQQEADNDDESQPSRVGALQAMTANNVTLARLDLRPSAESSYTSPSKRSRSPATTTTDLQFANIEFRAFSGHPLPENPYTIDLFNDIQAAAAGIGVIPSAIEAEIASITEKIVGDFISPHNIDTSYHMSKADAVQELHNLRTIIADAADCKVECQSEAAWNARVHDPLLRLAMERSTLSRIRPWIVTTANIIPALLPRNVVTGDAFGSPLVDFCITLEPDTTQKETIKQLLASQPTPLRSINQSLYAPLRFRPIAITIESETDAGTETGERRLALWIKAWLNRMKLLGAKDIPPLPLLRIRGHDWFLLLAWEDYTRGQEQQDGVEPTLVIHAEMPIGDTRSLLPIYRLLKVLRRLAIWADGPFREWHESTVANACYDEKC